MNVESPPENYRIEKALTVDGMWCVLLGDNLLAVALTETEAHAELDRQKRYQRVGVAAVQGNSCSTDQPSSALV